MTFQYNFNKMTDEYKKPEPYKFGNTPFQFGAATNTYTSASNTFTPPQQTTFTPPHQNTFTPPQTNLHDNILQKQVNELMESNSKILTMLHEIKMIDSDILKEFKTNTYNEVVHTGIHCDNCLVENIKGIRYKCLLCADIDFCEKCEHENIKHNHPFVKIRDSIAFIDVYNNLMGKKNL